MLKFIPDKSDNCAGKKPQEHLVHQQWHTLSGFKIQVYKCQMYIDMLYVH